MEQYIPKSTLLEEIEKRKGMCDNHYGDYWNGCYNTFTDILSFIDTLEVKEVDLESYNKIKRLLSLSFMHFLDKNRFKGKMCLSNMECADIDKAFDEMDWVKLFRYSQNYLDKAQKGE